MCKDYSKVSDFEINCHVHAEVMQISGLDSFKAKDYCNNPADAWPIIDDNEISLIPSRHSSGWVAASDLTISASSTYIDELLDNCFKHEDKNGLRAAMIVFLMMQEDENG